MRVGIGGLFLQRGFPYVEIPAKSRLYDVLCEIQIFRDLRQVIQFDEGFQNGTGIHPAPEIGSFRNGDLVFSVADAFDDVIGVFAQRVHDLSFQRLVFADVVKIFQPQHDVFSAPHIPAAEFVIRGIGGYAPRLVLRGKEVFHRFEQGVIEFYVAGYGVRHAAAAHHFSPEFAPPAVGGGVGMKAELIDEQSPQPVVEQLFFLRKTDHRFRIAAEARFRRKEGCGDPVGHIGVRCVFFHLSVSPV